MSAPPSIQSEQIRSALQRRELAMTRHRAAMALAMGLGDTEALAVAHLAEHGEVTQTELAELLTLSSGGTAALVQRLEQRGHVHRREGDHDKRMRLVSLSPRAVADIGRFSQPLEDEIETLIRRSGDGAATFVRFLDSLASITEHHAERARRKPPAAEAGAAITPGRWG